jgi:hypothetical protein
MAMQQPIISASSAAGLPAEGIVNRVAGSTLQSLDLEELAQQAPLLAAPRGVFDLAPHLWQGLVLREKEFRALLAEWDWNQYAGQAVAVYCATDAIVPSWAFMLVVARLQPVAAAVVLGPPERLEQSLWQQALAEVNWEEYRDAKLVIKGCADVPLYAFGEAMRRLKPLASSIMYGEPCSSVPLYKRPKSAE